MRSHRLAVWWRLLLAIGLLVPAAAAVSAASASPLAVGPHAKAPAVMPAGPSAGAPVAVHHARHVHHTTPMVAGVAATAVGFVVLLFSAGVPRRRASQLLGAGRRWWSSRAPPSGTGHLVPIGFRSGVAGRLFGSSRALFTHPRIVHC